MESRIVRFLAGSRIKPMSELQENEDHRQMLSRGQLEHVFIFWGLTNAAFGFGIVWFVIYKDYMLAYSVAALSGVLIVGMLALITALRVCSCDPSHSINLFVVFFIIMTLAGPVACHLMLGGGSRSADIIIFSILAPVSALFLVHWRPLTITCLVTAVRQILVLGIILGDPDLDYTYSLRPTQSQEWEEAGILIFSHTIVPVLIIAAFRRALADFQLWQVSVQLLRDHYVTSQEVNQRLVECLVPESLGLGWKSEGRDGDEGEVVEFDTDHPEQWFMLPPIWHRDCSVLQVCCACRVYLFLCIKAVTCQTGGHKQCVVLPPMRRSA